MITDSYHGVINYLRLPTNRLDFDTKRISALIFATSSWSGFRSLQFFHLITSIFLSGSDEMYCADNFIAVRCGFWVEVAQMVAFSLLIRPLITCPGQP